MTEQNKIQKGFKIGSLINIKEKNKVSDEKEGE